MDTEIETPFLITIYTVTVPSITQAKKVRSRLGLVVGS